MTQPQPKIWQRLRGALKPLNQPRHYALGVVVGMLIGVVPKFSIIPWVVMLVGMLLPTNLMAMVLSAVAFSFIVPLFDVHTNRLGAALLTDESLASFWHSLLSHQYSNWLQLHNSVVLGSTLITACAALPLYFVSNRVSRFLKPIFTKYVLSNGVADWIRGYPLQTG